MKELVRLFYKVFSQEMMWRN